MPSSLRGVITLCLLALPACRAPRPFEDPASRAALEAAREEPEITRPDFLRGFESGRRMVSEALLRGERPFLPLLSAHTEHPNLLGTSAANVEVEEAPPEPEVDLATGLPVKRIPDANPLSRGEVAGFRWAFEGAQDRLAHPLPEPALPSSEAWVVVEGDFTLLMEGNLQVLAQWRHGALMWKWVQGGFPSQRRWRPAPDWMAPRAMALGRDALWVRAEAKGCLALDLDSGLIRRVVPGPAVP